MLGFGAPWALALLGVVPAWIWWRRRTRPALGYPRVYLVRAVRRPPARWSAHLPDALRVLVWVALVLAVARPRVGSAVVETESEGITIVLAIDISSSMLALDMQPHDRIGAAKETVVRFVRARPHDRIGVVAFAGEAITQVPVTLDHAVVERAVSQLRVGMLEDGTAIGTAIATAANRLRRTGAGSRVLVLLTDGENNRGQVDPVTAARAAAAYGIRIYTIGVGTEGVAPVPVAQGPFGLEYANRPVRIDEPLLRRIAAIGGGQYFRATDAGALEEIYRRIDRLERTPVRVRRRVEYTEYGRIWLVLAAGLLLAEWALRVRRYPLVA